MPCVVDDLVRRPELATRFVAGRDGRLRRIAWAHVCEQPDPWVWIGEGDLLMTTGLGVPRSAAAQVEYVERLAGVGAAGLAVGEDMNAPPLTPHMIDAAELHQLPVLLTRRDIPFIALARAVAEANAEAHVLRVEQTERVYEVLRTSSPEGLDLDGLLHRMSTVVGCSLGLVDGTAARTAVMPASVPPSLRDALRRRDPGPPEDTPRPIRLPGVEALVLAVPAPRPALLVAWSTSGGLPDPTVLRHVAAAAALHQTRLYADRERSLRLGASLLAQVLDQRITVSAARVALAGAGLGSTEWVLALWDAVAAGGDAHLLHHDLEDAGVAHLVLTRPPLTYVLLRDDRESVEAVLAALGDGVSVGVSDPVSSPTDVVAAQRQAVWALHRATERRLAVLRHSDDLGDSVFLPGDREDSRAAARRVLGPVLTHDEVHGSRLLTSLRVFLEENRSWQRAAARLHVHKQTLVYRVRRVEALTGRSLSDTADVADLWLALGAATSSGLVDRDP